MTDWEMKVHNFMCLNKLVKKGEIVFTGSSLCELFPINEMLQNVEPRIRVYNRGIGGDVTDFWSAWMNRFLTSSRQRCSSTSAQMTSAARNTSASA